MGPSFWLGEAGKRFCAAARPPDDSPAPGRFQGPGVDFLKSTPEIPQYSREAQRILAHHLASAGRDRRELIRDRFHWSA